MEFGRIGVAPPSFDRPARVGTKPETGSTGFSEVLTQAVDKLEQVQHTADTQADALGKGDGNLHEATLALEKADVAMRLATKVRNKFVEAYQEIMRMNV